MNVCYLDLLFALNAAVDYLLLLAACRLTARYPNRRRMALGAVWGGLCAVAAALFPAPGTAAALALPGGLAAVWIAFGFRRWWAPALAYFAAAAAFAGTVIALLRFSGSDGDTLAVNMPTLAAAFALCYAAVRPLCRLLARRQGPLTAAAAVTLAGRETVFPALRDTGNQLYDPVSGQRVMVCTLEALLPLLPELRDFRGDALALYGRLGETAALRGRVRLLPYRALGGEDGLLPLFRPERITINGITRDDLLLAVTARPLADDGSIQGLF